MSFFNIYFCILANSFHFWAFLDTIKIGLLSGYLCLHYLNNTDYFNAEYFILLTTVAVSFMQGFGFFKLCSQTRRLMRIFIFLIEESFSLLFLLSYVLLAVLIVLYINAENGEFKDSGFFSLYKEPSTQPLSSVLESFLDYIGPGIVFILLLAICNNTYEESEDIAIRDEFQELFRIVLRGEYLMPWKRKEHSMQFLHACVKNSFKELNKVKKISKTIKNLKIVQDDSRFQVMEGFAEINEKLEVINQTILEIKSVNRHSRKSKNS